MPHSHHGRSSTRYVDEEVEIERRRSSRPPLDFLREDYDRNSNAGPMVLRERDRTVIDDESIQSRAGSRRDDPRRDDPRRIIGDRRVRDGEHRRVEEDEVLITRPRRRRPSIKDNEASGEEGQLLRRDRERERLREDERIEIAYRDRRGAPRPESEVKISEREEFTYRPRREQPGPVAHEREEWVFRHEKPAFETEQVTIRERERTPPLPPPSPREDFREEIDIRHVERDSRHAHPDYYEDDIRIRERANRSSEDAISVRHRDREPPLSRYGDEEEIRIRERSRPGYRDEEIDIRERSRGPPPSRRGWDEEIDIRERERSGRGYREEEIDIRQGGRERPRPPPPSSVYHEDDIRIRDHGRPGYRDEEITIKERDRERPRPPPSRYSEEEIDIRESDRRGRHEEQIRIRERSRSRRPPADRERDVIIKHKSSPSPEPLPEAYYRRNPSPREEEQIVIKRDEKRDGGRKEEIIIRRDKSRSPSPERSPTPPPVLEPGIIRAPTIHQEVVTHHRHIDHGYEATRPQPRAPSPPPAPRTVVDEEIDIIRRGERDGRRFDDTVEIDRKVREAPRARTPLPEVRPRSPPPARPKSSLEVDIRRRGDRAGDFYDEDIRISEGVRNSRNLAPRERRDAELVVREESRRYVGGHPVEDRMWTEITKDLVVREALESFGYEVEETEHFFYVMEFLRYEDVSRLVAVSDKIRRGRKDRIRQMEYEHRHAPPLSPSRPPLALSERPWDEERIYERDVIYNRPPRPRRAPPSPQPLRKETEEVRVSVR